MLFRKANLESISLMKNTLNHFQLWSKLKVNLPKSNLYLFRVFSEEKEHFKFILDIEVGSLPFKYLGVSITSSKLKKIDCKPLIDTIMGRITS